MGLYNSPFKLVFGCDPELGLEGATMPIDVYVDLTDANLQKDYRSTWRNHKKNMFQPGDLVLTQTTGKEKLGTPWQGPFAIDEVIGPRTYRIRHPDTGQVVRMVHVRQLKPYRERESRTTLILPRECDVVVRRLPCSLAERSKDEETSFDLPYLIYGSSGAHKKGGPTENKAVAFRVPLNKLPVKVPGVTHTTQH